MARSSVAQRASHRGNQHNGGPGLLTAKQRRTRISIVCGPQVLRRGSSSKQSTLVERNPLVSPKSLK
eukprot:1365607-Amphidinium_carterae.4